MKIRHKVNFGWQPPPPPITDAYQGEIDASLRKAEKAWRKAQKAAQRAERAAEARPSPETRASAAQARQAVEDRLAELRDIERLMRGGGRQTTVAHRTGREERLEIGVPGKRRRKKNPTHPVTRSSL